MEASVSSFEQLGFLLAAAGSRKLLETRHCLEGENGFSKLDYGFKYDFT